MTLAIDGGDVFALAKLMLESDEAQASADDEQLRAARDAERQELDRQVRDLHEAASDARGAGWVEGCVAFAGGALSTVGAATAPKSSTKDTVTMTGGRSLSALAGPAGAVAFGASEKDADARAKQHEALSADAGARVAEAEHHRDRVLDNEDRMLSTLQSTLQSEADGRLAIIANG